MYDADYRESNPSHRFERCGLSPLLHPCFPVGYYYYFVDKLISLDEGWMLHFEVRE
jgi:hypothetical protein